MQRARLARLAAHLRPAPSAAAVDVAPDIQLGDLDELEDSSALLPDVGRLGAKLEADGYALLRGFHPREDVAAARREWIDILAAQDGVLKRGTAADETVFGGTFPANAGNERGPALLNCVESPKLMQLFSELLDEPSRTFDHKWLRCIPPTRALRPDHGVFMGGAHADIVFMGAGQRRMWTVWTPFGDVPREMGALALCLGTHKHPRLQSTYCTMDTHAFLCNEPSFPDPVAIGDFCGGRWASTDFRMGDVRPALCSVLCTRQPR